MFLEPTNPFTKENLNMNRKIVLTTGVFHILHPGHIELLEYCSSLGSVWVGINTDQYIINKSGEVIIPLVDRIYLLKSIRFVEHVVAFSEENASTLIAKIRPHIFVKGPDYKDKHIPEEDVCRLIGTKYIVAPQLKRYSSSELLKLSKH